MEHLPKKEQEYKISPKTEMLAKRIDTAQRKGIFGRTSTKIALLLTLLGGASSAESKGFGDLIKAINNNSSTSKNTNTKNNNKPGIFGEIRDVVLEAGKNEAEFKIRMDYQKEREVHQKKLDELMADLPVKLALADVDYKTKLLKLEMGGTLNLDVSGFKDVSRDSFGMALSIDESSNELQKPEHKEGEFSSQEDLRYTLETNIATLKGNYMKTVSELKAKLKKLDPKEKEERIEIERQIRDAGIDFQKDSTDLMADYKNKSSKIRADERADNAYNKEKKALERKQLLGFKSQLSSAYQVYIRDLKSSYEKEKARINLEIEEINEREERALSRIKSGAKAGGKILGQRK